MEAIKLWNHIDCAQYGERYYLAVVIQLGPTIRIKGSRRQFPTALGAEHYAKRWHEHVIKLHAAIR